MSCPVDIQLLGDVQVVAGGRVLALHGRRQLRLLAALALNVSRVVSIDRLTEVVWPPGTQMPATARRQIQDLVSRLRKDLTGAGSSRSALAAQGSGYVLRIPANAVDVSRFRHAVAVGRASRDIDPERAAIEFRSALRQWRGDALAGLNCLSLDAERAGLAELRMLTWEQVIEIELDLLRHEELLGELAALVELHPTRERLVQLHMQALYQAGRTADALNAFQGLRRRLAADLGVEPSQQLQDAHLTLLRNDRPGRRQPPRAQRPGGPPPGRAEAKPPFQLPADLPDFVGRRDVVNAVVAALSARPGGAYPAAVSITGIPGVGKSSLAVHAAHLLRNRYPGGQIYLDLASAGAGAVDPHDGLGRVLLALAVASQALPTSTAERAALLQSLTARRSLLLVLDNAAETAQVFPLLPANPRCGVLVTSRSVLSGLSAWPNVAVTPLDQPDSLELLGCIIDPHRVAAEPTASTRIAEICAGLPLAIRIAGTRIAARSHQSLTWFADRLSSDQTRLDELAVGGVTIRGSFDISYHGLGPAERRALRLLGLLEVPDFAAWLAAAALGCRVADAEDRLDSLVGAGLLSVAATGVASPPRFRFHQLSRLYAVSRAKTEESETSRTAALVRAYGTCVALAGQADQRLRRSVPLAASEPSVELSSELIGMHRGVPPDAWFAAERGTLVAVVQAAAGLGRPDLAWNLSLALQRYLESHHHFSDWAHVVGIGLAAARASQNLQAEAALLCSLGEQHAVNDDHAAAREAFGRASQIARECGYRPAQAHALRGLSASYLAGGNLRQAMTTAQAALDLVDPATDPNEAAEIQMGLGAALYLLGELDRSEHYYLRALASFEQLGDLMNMSIVLVDLGSLYRDSGRLDLSEQALRRSARICGEIEFDNGKAFAYCGLGALLAHRGDTAQAEQALLDALAIVRQHTDLATEAKIRCTLGELYLHCNPPQAKTHFADSVTLAATLELNGQLARALTGLGDAEQQAGNPAAAVAAWRDALDLRHALDPVRAAGLRDRLDARP
jgi:DNA-binding SARP family transcriptional activator/tetratricopeptide (TPR) repeat protein